MSRLRNALFVAGALAAGPNLARADQPVVSHTAKADTYLSKESKNTNFGNATTLVASKEVKSVVLLAFDATVGAASLFTDPFTAQDYSQHLTDCNLTADIAKAEIVLDISSATDCGPQGCKLTVRTTDDFVEGDGVAGSGSTWKCANDSDISNDVVDCAESWHGGNTGAKVGKATVSGGTTGELRIDVTDHIRELDRGSLDIRFIVRSKGPGTVTFSAREGAVAPRLVITKADIPTYENQVAGITRSSVNLSGINVSYLSAGDSNSPNVFVLLHGQPAFSYMFRNTVARLGLSGYAIAPDLIGTGLSDRPALNTYDYKATTQAAKLHELITTLGLTQSGRKVILVAHENGALAGLHYATQHQADVQGVVVSEAYLDYCPTYQEGIACSANTLVFDPGIEQVWQYVVYNTQGPNPWTNSCNVLRSFSTADSMLAQTTRGISPQVIAQYQSQWSCQFNPNYTFGQNGFYDVCLPGGDQECNLDYGLGVFPQLIPTNLAAGPQDSLATVIAYTAAMKSWGVKKLFLYSGLPGVVNNWGQVDYVLQTYPGMSAACIGGAGHLAPEDEPYNFANRIVEWAAAESLLQ